MWIKSELADAGVDISVSEFMVCLSASSSKSKDIGVSLNEIPKRGCWKSKQILNLRDIINEEDNLDFEFDYVTPILSNSSIGFGY